MNLIFVGPQGSGKGTQAKIVAEKKGLCHISTGDLLRGAEGDLKNELDDYMNSGKLVPDELIVKILKERMEKPDCGNGIILDGFPRNSKQAEILDEMLEIDKVIEINIPDKESIRRIEGRMVCIDCGEGYNVETSPMPEKEGLCDKCGGKLIKRDDDTAEAVKKRLEIYHSETEPVLEYYGDKVLSVNGMKGIDNVSNEILEGI